MMRGTARFTSPTPWPSRAHGGLETIEFDAALLIAPGRAPDPRLVSARRRPHPHHARLLPAQDLPREHHGRRLRRHRCRVRAHVLVVRCQGHPRGQPPAGAARQGSRGGRRARGRLPAARRQAAEGCAGERRSNAPTTEVVVHCDDGRSVRSTHAVLAIGSIPNTDDLGLDAAGVEIDQGLRRDQPALLRQRGAHLRRRRHQRQAAAVVGRSDAGPQGGRARDGLATPAAIATSTTTRRRRRSSPSRRSPTSAWPRRRRSVPVARSASPRCRSRRRPKALINNDTRGS